VPELTIGQKAPPFRLPSAQGAEMGPDDFRGRSNLILFFAKGMGCGFCRQKMSQLARGLPRFRALGTEILMVTPSTLDRARFYARNFQLPYPYLCDPDYRVYEAYGMPLRRRSLAWKAGVFFHVMRMPPAETTEFGVAKPKPTEISQVLNDDDLGFFVLDRAGIVRYASTGAYVSFEGTKPVDMKHIPSNDEIVSALERCEGQGAETVSA
jgi:peroxiredoxin